MNTRSKRSNTSIDMTHGNIMQLVLLFALPLCVGNIFQQLYNTVDTLVVGNFCGSVSLAAVGTSSQPLEAMMCIFIGIGTGTSILVSQYCGAGDVIRLKSVIATSNTFLFLCAIPVTILGFFAGPAILKLMQVPDNTWDLAISYLNIIFLGTLGNLGYNMNSGILRGLGDSKSPLIFLIISCVVNIILDLFFVGLLHMDVAGAAWATVIAMLASWLFSILYIKRKYPELEFKVFSKKLDHPILYSMICIGLPLGLNNSIYSIGHILMQSLINTQGSDFMAGCSVATKLTGIANVAIGSLSAAATTFAGQNLGAQNYGRIKKGIIKIPLYSGIITCIAGLIATFYCRPILCLFTRDAAVLEVSIRYTWIVLPLTWTYAVFNALISFVNGMGEVKLPTIINILMLWAVRIPVGYLITYCISGQYMMACFPISWAFGMFAMFSYFFSKHWKSIISKTTH